MNKINDNDDMGHLVASFGVLSLGDMDGDTFQQKKIELIVG